MKYISSLFHQISKNTYSSNDNKSIDSSKWPEEWKTTYIKTYDRFEKIILPEYKKLEPTLTETIFTRKSERNDDSKSLNIQNLSTILKHSCGETDPNGLSGNGRRAVASAGARYPLEYYILVLKPINGLTTGLYHYRVDEHALEVIQKFTPTKELLSSWFTYEFSLDASIAIFISAVFFRTQNKYRERGYRFALLEAGAVGQAIQNAATALAVNSYCLGGFYDYEVEKFLDIDGNNESLVNCMILR
jgi:SagB-type dehydrogenase family enzyme